MSPKKPSEIGVPSEQLPRHIAIIMDGNGRWARRQGLRRIRGHRAGSETVRRITTECAALGLDRLTLYAFSSENWKRPKREIDFLMKLLREFLVAERGEIMENEIRFRAIGRLAELPEDVLRELAETVEMSRGNRGLVLTLALAYGGRAEIIDAVRRIAEEAGKGSFAPDDLTEESFRSWLYDPEMTDPDLLIRTGGEMRVSNYLLWQIAYTELYVTPVFWPDFREEHLHEAIRSYAGRERRFGGLPEEG
jgi:undecaprenyl diphosphate synthase